MGATFFQIKRSDIANQTAFDSFYDMFMKRRQAIIRMKIEFKTNKVQTRIISVAESKKHIDLQPESWNPIDVYASSGNIQIAMNTTDIIDSTFLEKDTAKLCDVNIFYNSSIEQLSISSTMDFSVLRSSTGFHAPHNMTFDLGTDNQTMAEIQIVVRNADNKVLAHWIFTREARKTCIDEMIYSIEDNKVCTVFFYLNRETCKSVAFVNTVIYLGTENKDIPGDRLIFAAFYVNLTRENSSEYSKLCFGSDKEISSKDLAQAPADLYKPTLSLGKRLKSYQKEIAKPDFTSFCLFSNEAEEVVIITNEVNSQFAFIIAVGVISCLALIGICVAICIALRSGHEEE